MNSIAACAYSIKATSRFPFKFLAWISIASLLGGCAGVSPSIGISVPIGRIGGVGVSIGGGGAVSGSVGVGAGGGSVSVGATGQLPQPAATKPEAESEKKDAKKP